MTSMKFTSAIIGIGVIGIVTPLLPSQSKPTPQPPAIHSHIVKAKTGERTLVQELRVDASIDAVWRAYSTGKGWMAWASPVAKVDLRAGGTIQTHYTLGAKIGAPGTNTLHIVNYVPKRLLTLRADLRENWPALMKKDAGNLMNVIVFQQVSKTQTLVISYGCGYGTSPEYEKLLKFFIGANEGLLRKLKTHLESGQKAALLKQM